MQSFTLEALKKWYREHKEAILEDYFTFLRFPSISTDPAFASDCRRTAEWLRAYLNKMGMQTELWETTGLPVVYASHLKAGSHRPTVLIYNHYDVQPVDPLSLWKNDPFDPTLRNNQVYARGASDNKGQCFYTLTALKAIFAIAETLNVNLKIMIEGEEECGGKGTTGILQKKKEALKADHLLVVDFGISNKETPSITLGMRGIVTMNVECTNSAVDLHSGVHGGIALNPNRVLATLIAGLWDSSGKVAVPHFYDDVRAVSKKDLASFDMTFDVEKYKKDFGVKAFSKEEGYTPMEANRIRPTLEINGISGGYTGTGFKTVIPAKAHAKISCRLVPDQVPEKIAERVAEDLKRRAPAGIEIHTEIHHGAPGYRSAIDSPIISIASAAYAEVFGKPCEFQLCGASVPIVVDLAKASGANVAMIGVALDSDDIHAPNEHFSLDCFELGYLSIGNIIRRLSSN